MLGSPIRLSHPNRPRAASVTHMAIVLGLRFFCEMAALAAVAYWGQQAAGGVAGIALAAALWSAGQPTLAVVLFVVAVVTGAINARTAPTTAIG